MKANTLHSTYNIMPGTPCGVYFIQYFYFIMKIPTNPIKENPLKSSLRHNRQLWVFVLWVRMCKSVDKAD